MFRKLLVYGLPEQFETIRMHISSTMQIRRHKLLIHVGEVNLSLTATSRGTREK